MKNIILALTVLFSSPVMACDRIVAPHDSAAPGSIVQFTPERAVVTTNERAETWQAEPCGSLFLCYGSKGDDMLVLLTTSENGMDVVYGGQTTFWRFDCQ